MAWRLSNPLLSIRVVSYVDKKFSGIETEKKTFSIGARTTLLRFFDKDKVFNSAVAMADVLKEFSPDQELQIELFNAIQEGDQIEVDSLRLKIKKLKDDWTKQNDIDYEAIKKDFHKTIKPLFRVDGAIGYSALFKENEANSGTANRFGSWLTAEGSLLLNDGGTSKTNNYFNIFFTARYIEDEFNINSDNNYFTNYYRDFGGKLSLNLGNLPFRTNIFPEMAQ